MSLTEMADKAYSNYITQSINKMTMKKYYDTEHSPAGGDPIQPAPQVNKAQGERKRKAGYYWVRFNDGDWILGMWFFGNYWLLPGSVSNLQDSYFKEINENRVCPQEPPPPDAGKEERTFTEADLIKYSKWVRETKYFHDGGNWYKSPKELYEHYKKQINAKSNG